MIRRKDEEHLHFATAQGRALYSFNVGDFYEIHTAWVTSGHDHCGIVLTQQRRYSLRRADSALAAADWPPVV